uniref:Uncharacterized protein n=1 Tax=Cajanus cajan TaxID=3821 RepID=A0A151ST70_CAJCA|nr:hypothetical protein KK1_004283 [Cajanus cajan]
MVIDHYLTIRPWVSNFMASKVHIDNTKVWIHFLSLGREYYDKSILVALTTTVRKPVKVDMSTIDITKVKFAQVYDDLK